MDHTRSRGYFLKKQQITKVIQERNLLQLVDLVHNGLITSIGIRQGHFEMDKDFIFNSVHFNLDVGAGLNLRVVKNSLYLDLWFKAANTKHPDIIEEHVTNGQREILLTIVVTNIEYISTNSERFYW